MSLDANALKTSFDLVVSRRPDLTERFYEILFADHPELASMFGHNARKAQAEMLAQALAAVIDHLDDAPWLQRTLGGLGARHVGYGVTPEMYGWVGAALLQTLAEVAGDDWTPSLAEQWAAAFGAIQSLMLAGTVAAAA